MRVWVGYRHENEVKHELVWAAIATAGIAAAAVLPHLPRFPFPCLLLTLTGHPCLTCGMTRSWMAATGGRLGEAWRWNPAGLALFFLAAGYAVYGWTVTVLRLRPMHVRLTERWEVAAARVAPLAALAGNWVYVWTNGVQY